jgi:hypothetical protein
MMELEPWEDETESLEGEGVEDSEDLELQEMLAKKKQKALNREKNGVGAGSKKKVVDWLELDDEEEQEKVLAPLPLERGVVKEPERVLSPGEKKLKRKAEVVTAADSVGVLETASVAREVSKEVISLRGGSGGAGGEKVGSIIDFRATAANVAAIINEQCMIGKDVKDLSEIKLSEVALNKIKSETIMDGLRGIIAFEHEAELLSGVNKHFKRSQELDTLQSQLDICELGSLEAKALYKKAMNKLAELTDPAYGDESDDGSLSEKILLWQGIADHALAKADKLIAMTGRVIQMERYSGGRGWGSKSSGNVNHGTLGFLGETEREIKDRKKGSLAGGDVGPRKLTVEETVGLARERSALSELKGELKKTRDAVAGGSGGVGGGEFFGYEEENDE